MHGALVSLAMVCVTALAAIGLAGVSRGWVPPWGRSRVLRPRLWGTGALLSAAGLSFFMFLGPLGDARPLHVYLPLAGMGVNFVGLALQMLAQRPGRALTPPTTTTAS
ncbi:hypothetical protein [Streptomyces sp. NPDC001315]|uniref:hypothetical protein n=1 Tax=Streptomyces sp. NPDC001315 TaxID=3364562 RepID=UPI0036BAA87C